jgi:glutamyl-tRNA reductase
MSAGKLVMVGISHHAAPLEIRERVAIDETAWRAVAPASIGSILLATCNRVEIYAWAEDRGASTARALRRALARAADLDWRQLRLYVTTRIGREALVHLVRVTSGLDSLVVGEEQIRGQVRQALRAAEASGPLPSELRGVFQRVGEAARRVRADTNLATAPSVASAGVSVALRMLGGASKQAAVVLGAGVMARAATEALLARGVQVKVLNRTPAHAERVFGNLGPNVTIDSLAVLPDVLRDAGLVVGATASRAYVIDGSVLEDRSAHPLVMLDIAMPRDIDPLLRETPGVTLIDLDDLERMCPVDAGTRHAEVEQAEALAIDEAERMQRWLRFREVGPAITELRTYAETIRKSELRRAAARLRDLTPEQIAAVEALTSGIVNKLMHGPTVALRDAAARPGGLDRSSSRILRVVRPSRGRAV